MKRIMTVILALLMLMSLGACDGSISLFPGESKESEGELIYPDENDQASGYLGDTLRTTFFDMRLDRAYTCYEYDGVTPEAGNKLLVAEITLYNYTNTTQPMYFTDFEIWWDNDDDGDVMDFETYMKHWPMVERESMDDGSYEYNSVSELQLPTEYDLPIQGTKTGILLYQVPEASKSYSIFFEELFEDGSEEGSTGALFEIVFSALLEE